MFASLRSASAVRRFVCAVACFGWFASAAFAQTTPPAAPADPPVSLAPIDTDGDGKITRAEWTKFTQSFATLDANKDQAVDLDELQKAGGGTTETPGILPASDADGNGKLTRPEWINVARGFPRFDRNSDGGVTQPEMQAMAARAKEAAKPNATANSSAGLWRGWIVNNRGDNPNDMQMQIELMIEGNRITGREIPRQGGGQGGGGQGGGGRPLGAGTFVMTGNAQNGNLDAQYTEGPNSGQTCLGIFRMQGDVLQWCASNRPGQRPNDFMTGGGNWLMLLRKADATAQQ